MSINRAAVAVARQFFLADVDDGEWGERAWDDMGGSEPAEERVALELTAVDALEDALPHLTVGDVPHVAAQAVRDAADELARSLSGYSHDTPQTLAGRAIIARLRERATRLAPQEDA